MGTPSDSSGRPKRSAFVVVWTDRALVDLRDIELLDRQLDVVATQEVLVRLPEFARDVEHRAQ
jgi:hypothetical protein